MLNYNHLRYFWVVAREGRLTKAAERLNLSQSALSSQIKKLEDRLGHELFERRGRSLVLTEAGQIVLGYADAIFTVGEEMLSRLQSKGDASRQRLRVGALSTLSRNFQIAFLRPVFQDVETDIVIRSGAMGELVAALEAHRLDVVLVNQLPMRTSEASWTAHLLDEQPVSLIGAPSKEREAMSLRELLAHEPLILPSAESGYRNDFDVLAQRLGVEPTIAAEIDDMAMLRLLAREHIGTAVLPPIVVTDELSAGRLVEYARLADIRESFFAIVSHRRFPNRVLEVLLDQHRLTERRTGAGGGQADTPASAG